VKIPWASLATQAIEVWFEFSIDSSSHLSPMRCYNLMHWIELSGTHSGR
jgi:hypothetical protein